MSKENPPNSSPAAVFRQTRGLITERASLCTLSLLMFFNFHFLHFPRDSRRKSWNFPLDFLLASFCKHTRKQNVSQTASTYIFQGCSCPRRDCSGRNSGQKIYSAKSPRLAATKEELDSNFFFSATVLHELKTFSSSSLFVYIESHSGDELRRFKFISACCSHENMIHRCRSSPPPS